MSRKHITELYKIPVILLDSITEIRPSDTESIIISASHGGISSGGYASNIRSAIVFFNDAGVGKDGAGIAALEILQDYNIAAGTTDFMSARIGDSIDVWENGIISHLNLLAEKAGFQVGISLRQQIEELFKIN
tara:strand:+ start:414 stop:812 length:399 start_codon:yes stop_codon:yes gene_type:complete